MKRAGWLNMAYSCVLPVLLATFFGLVLLRTLVYFNPFEDSSYLTVYLAETIGVVFFGLLALLILSICRRRLEKSRMGAKVERRLVIGFFIVLVAVQALFAAQMNVPLNLQCVELNGHEMCLWDLNAVASGAIEVTETGTPSQYTLDYLHKCQNNIPIFALLSGVFKLMSLANINNYGAIGSAMNIMAIDIAIFIAYMIVRKLYGRKKALFSLVLMALAFLPLTLLHVPIFYTDTLSLPYPVAALYLYLLLREAKTTRKYYVLLFAMILAAFLGAMLKFSSLIVVAAIVIDMILRHRKNETKRVAISVGCVVLVLALLLCGYAALTEKFVHSKATPGTMTTPPTHYIMMGMGQTNGGQYDAHDDAETYARGSRDEAIKYNLEEIKERLSNFGPTGYVEFLYMKAASTWSDGGYNAPKLLNNANIITKDFHPSELQKMVTSGKKYPLTFANYLRSMQILLLAMLLIGAIKIATGRKNRHIMVFWLAVFGLAVFLLIWETNSRYLINYLPIMVVLVAPIAWNLSEPVVNKIRHRYLAIRLKILRY